MVDRRLVVDLDPIAGAWAVRVRGGGVGYPRALRVDNEPGLDPLRVTERRRNGVVPSPRDLRSGYQVDKRHVRQYGF
ncbi:hypothetical protein TIFTF001_010795 [Ficus carica]|uniref:Uncharacterized protein n=1 Tax=Ficus carica TaxID=3494 RepID=A0AA88D3P4_FICCA|nr:hypothetical protein TIFTF001_010795 [Ficus carica]